MKMFADRGVSTRLTPYEIAESSDVVITMLPSSSHVSLIDLLRTFKLPVVDTVFRILETVGKFHSVFEESQLMAGHAMGFHS